MTTPATSATARLTRLRGLYAIVGSGGAGSAVGEAGAAIEGGASVVQVRVKDAPAGDVLRAARQVVALARGRALVLVNDRADLALLSGADGVHVGDEDLQPAEVRRLVGPDLLLGRTCRTPEAARAALAEGADHVGFGPIFAARSKVVDAPPRGIPALRELCRGLPAPVVAIGGIDLATVGEVAAAGAACAAVISAVFGDAEPRAAAGRLARAFEAGRARQEAR
jgi:thiamine-phosphate pyrophosphorylase